MKQKPQLWSPAVSDLICPWSDLINIKVWKQPLQTAPLAPLPELTMVSYCNCWRVGLEPLTSPFFAQLPSDCQELPLPGSDVPHGGRGCPIPSEPLWLLLQCALYSRALTSSIRPRLDFSKTTSFSSSFLFPVLLFSLSSRHFLKSIPLTSFTTESLLLQKLTQGKRS